MTKGLHNKVSSHREGGHPPRRFVGGGKEMENRPDSLRDLKTLVEKVGGGTQAPITPMKGRD